MISFRKASEAFLMNFADGRSRPINMGVLMYEHWVGPTPSGATQWKDADAARERDNKPNMVKTERAGAREFAERIKTRKAIPKGAVTITLGAGTADAFAAQERITMQAYDGREAILVESSSQFLHDICTDPRNRDLILRKMRTDFMSGRKRYYDEDDEAVVTKFGNISNIHAPVRDLPPEKELIKALKQDAGRIRRGFLIMSFDADQNGESVTSYYKEHGAFQLNFLDRMAAEGEREGWLKHFNPRVFAYDADWHQSSSSGQLAHTAVLPEHMPIILNGQEILLKPGRTPIKNSFKFTSAFYEHCVGKAGLDIDDALLDLPVKFYSIRSEPKRTELFEQRSVKQSSDLHA